MALDATVPRCGHPNPFGCPNHGPAWRGFLAHALTQQELRARLWECDSALDDQPIAYKLTQKGLVENMWSRAEAIL